MSFTNLSPHTRPAKQAARIASIAIVGISYFLTAVIALHFLRPDYDPVSRFVSEYAVGSYGFLMTSAFFGLSLGSLALVIGLYQGVSRSARSWIGLILLGIWGVAILIAGIFPTALKGAPATTSDKHSRPCFSCIILEPDSCYDPAVAALQARRKVASLPSLGVDSVAGNFRDLYRVFSNV